MNALNDSVITEFRANGGVVTEAMGGHFRNSTLALVHHVGRRTGTRRVQPVLCMADGGHYVLIGSNGGAAEEPSWVGNLEAMSETTLELGALSFPVKPTVLRDGDERERLYAAYTAFWPDITDYEKNTDRTFPVVLLEPLA
ncbi:nitroreductase/quinone reductase family protein [Streptomyces liangshanensis]|uniref:nitroreductase/quinone reductase family protein n=1 Tax=Streptomyces liangshanensis TaxID=2717324 RepID=UPI0036D99778